MRRADPPELPRFLRERVLPSHDGREVKRALLTDLLAAAEADVALLYAVVRREGEATLRAFGVTVEGAPPAFEQALLGLEGAPIMPLADLHSISSTTEFEVQQREAMPPTLVKQIWDPSGVHCGMGVNLLDDDGGHVGWIGAFRLGDSPRFEARVAPRVAQRVAPYRDLLIATHRMDAGGPAAATMVMDEAGAVLLASSQADAWLGMPRFREALHGDLAALHAARAESRQTHFRSAAVTVTRVEGAIGQAYVVTVTPQPTLKLPAVIMMTRAQRTVAEYAGLGLSVAEIAKLTTRSPETVRSHLRAIYDHLGIASRAELAMALAEVT